MSEKDATYILHKKDKDSTSVWSHFLKSVDNKTAKCKKCGFILKTLGGSTKGLHTHLLSKHNNKVDSINQNLPSCSQENDSTPSRKRTLTDYFNTEKKSTLDETLARMTALDGLTFNVFVTSKDLRQLLMSSGFENLPKSVDTIKNRVINYSLNIRQLISKEISQCKVLGTRFALSFDEWTSTTNKRYMNINLHIPKKHWNLGLIRIYGSMTAEKCIEALKTRLEEFNVKINDDIVGIVTDGPNVMVRVGKLLEVEHQLCLVHGIHLAVCDVLYKKSSMEVSYSETLAEIDSDSSDDSEDENIDVGLNLGSSANDATTIVFDEQNIENLVKKVRKVVLMFKRSPTKNDAILQKYVKVEKGKELALILDCKTRWNSLLSMLDRFLHLKTCIQKALIDLNCNISVDENEFSLISEIIQVLVPIKLAVDALCRQDANLCTADAVLKFLLQEIFIIQSNFANKMFQALKTRVEQRRREEITGVLKYLQNPEHDKEIETSISKIFSIPSQNIIKKQIKKLIERLSKKGNIEICDSDENMFLDNDEASPSQAPSHVSTPSSLKQRLEDEISNSMKAFESKSNTFKLMQTISKEMSLFENDGNRGYHLELVYQYLLSIPPASIEPERAFSAAAYLGNKIRNRLKDSTLDALLFLRAYFQNEKKK